MKKHELLKKYREKINQIMTANGKYAFLKVCPKDEYLRGQVLAFREIKSDLEMMNTDYNSCVEFSSGTQVMHFVSYLVTAGIPFKFDGARGVYLLHSENEAERLILENTRIVYDGATVSETTA